MKNRKIIMALSFVLLQNIPAAYAMNTNSQEEYKWRGDDTIDIISNALNDSENKIKGMGKKDLESARMILDTLNSQYGNSEEFSLFKDRYKNLDNEINKKLSDPAPQSIKKVYESFDQFMTTKFGRKALKYGFFTLIVDNNNPPNQGFKIHVSATNESATKIATLVIPKLEELKAHSKIVVSQLRLQQLNNNPTQAGKFITIYPENDERALLIAQELDDLLTKNTDPSDFIPIPSDASLGKSGGLFTRYGGFKEHHLTVVDSHNQPILKNNSPQHIVDDRTGPYKPEFVTWNPFGKLLHDPSNLSSSLNQSVILAKDDPRAHLKTADMVEREILEKEKAISNLDKFLSDPEVLMLLAVHSVLEAIEDNNWPLAIKLYEENKQTLQTYSDIKAIDAELKDHREGMKGDTQSNAPSQDPMTDQYDSILMDKYDLKPDDFKRYKDEAAKVGMTIEDYIQMIQ